jgi:GT2 family glycosyltransferase
MKISIVMAYYNRRVQLLNTLASIQHSSKIKDTEVIIINDNSSEEHKIDDLSNLFDMDIKVTNIQKENRWWVCPCVPYNMGFKQATGDIVVIQNPECLHYNDILSIAEQHTKSNTYISFFCYCISRTNTFNIIEEGYNKYYHNIEKHVKPFENHITQNCADGSECGWYNHPQYRPCLYHFCGSMMREDLLEMGGFDERYAMGIAFDDDEFVQRIKRRGMKISMAGGNNLAAIHQWHEHSKYEGINVQEALNRNQILLHNVTMNETGWKVN